MGHRFASCSGAYLYLPHNDLYLQPDPKPSLQRPTNGSQPTRNPSREPRRNLRPVRVLDQTQGLVEELAPDVGPRKLPRIQFLGLPGAMWRRVECIEVS